MSAVVLPTHGRWAWDARGDGRAVRVSTHGEAGLLNLSFWRDDICVGTARLRPGDVAQLVDGLVEGLAALASRPRPVDSDAARLHELELRLARLEHESCLRSGERRLPDPRRVVASMRRWATRAALRSAGPGR